MFFGVGEFYPMFLKSFVFQINDGRCELCSCLSDQNHPQYYSRLEQSSVLFMMSRSGDDPGAQLRRLCHVVLTRAGGDEELVNKHYR